MRLRWPALGALLVLLTGLAPLLSVIVAGSIATAGNCALDEGGPHSCVLLGHDIGDTLYTMAVAGWLQLLMWPVALAGLAGLLAVAVLALVRVFRRKAANR